MELEWTLDAIAGMADIHHWVSEKFSLKVADEVKEEVITRVLLLLNLPLSGALDPYFEHIGEGHRFVMKRHTRIVYLVQGKLIRITNVFDMRMNPEFAYRPGRK